MLGRATSEVDELRAAVREWRRGRATASLGEVLQDAYVAVFSVLMVGAMAANVVVGFRREADDVCVAAGCTGARAVLPWLVVAASLAAITALARLLGPVFTSPAVGAWLLSTPVDRSSVLRRRLLVVTASAVLAAALVALPATGLAGVPGAVVAAATAGAALAAVGLVALAATAQQHGRPVDRVVLWLLLATAWTGLLSLALDVPPTWPAALPRRLVAVVALAVLAVAALALTVVAWRNLDRLRRRQLEPGGNLSAGLSGALATLDLALAYDVVLAHTARARGTVRSRRGGPVGPLALVWRDVLRLRRRPVRVLVVAAAVVAPYAVGEAGAGRFTVLVAVGAGFLAVVPLCLALRVLTRTPSLARMLPQTAATTRGSALVVPGMVALGYGLACAPALGAALGTGVVVDVRLGVAVAAGVLTSAAWWMCGRPVDYAVPAVSTPAGALPPGVVAGVLRGPDLVLVTSLPMLVAPTATGATVTLVLCAAVLSYLLARR